jgi:hypothetical protein
MPRMRPFHVAQLQNSPSGTGLESIRRTISVPSRRICRSAIAAKLAKVCAKMPAGRRALASDRVERHSLSVPKW